MTSDLTTALDRWANGDPWRVAFGMNRRQYRATRARREQALAELAEIELQEKRAELIPAGDVLEAWSAIVSVMRQRLLSLPSRLAAVVPGHSTHQETEAAAMLLVRECLTDLASAGEDGMRLAEARRK
jgi:hypothetical protein